MDEIIKKATALGEALRDSEEMKEYLKLEIVYNNDEEAQRITKEYNEMRENLANEARREDITPMEMLEIRKQLGQKFEEVSKNEVIAKYMDAKQEVENLISKANNIIRYFVTGEMEEESSCSGNCSSCGGCH